VLFQGTPAALMLWLSCQRARKDGSHKANRDKIRPQHGEYVCWQENASNSSGAKLQYAPSRYITEAYARRPSVVSPCRRIIYDAVTFDADGGGEVNGCSQSLLQRSRSLRYECR